jgi:hypothetical protein
MKLKIVAISDVHNKYQKLIIPECDILISAGDYSFRGKFQCRAIMNLV